MPTSIRSEATRSVVVVNGVDKLAINEDGSMELLTPPSVAQGANDLVTAGNKLQCGTAQNATGTAIDFTGIPSWARKITVLLNGVSTNGVSPFRLQIGNSSGIKVSGYSGSVSVGSTATAFAGGFDLTGAGAESLSAFGVITLYLQSGETWTECGSIGWSNASLVGVSGGAKSLSDPLDRIRLTTVNGTDIFDAGSVNIMWE